MSRIASLGLAVALTLLAGCPDYTKIVVSPETVGGEEVHDRIVYEATMGNEGWPALAMKRQEILLATAVGGTDQINNYDVVVWNHSDDNPDEAGMVFYQLCPNNSTAKETVVECFFDERHLKITVYIHPAEKNKFNYLRTLVTVRFWVLLHPVCQANWPVFLMSIVASIFRSDV